MDSRKSPKLSRASQEGQRSPRLLTRKPPVRSPSLTRREFTMDGITEVLTHSCTIYTLLSTLRLVVNAKRDKTLVKRRKALAKSRSIFAKSTC